MTELERQSKLNTKRKLITASLMSIVMGIGLFSILVINHESLFYTTAEIIFWASVVFVYIGLITILITIISTRKC